MWRLKFYCIKPTPGVRTQSSYQKGQESHSLHGAPGSSLRAQRFLFCSWCFTSPCQYRLNIYSACMSLLQCRWHLYEPRHTGVRGMLWLTSCFLQGKLLVQVQLPGFQYALLITHLNTGHFMFFIAPAPPWALFQSPANTRLLWGPSPLAQSRAPMLVRGSLISEVPTANMTRFSELVWALVISFSTPKIILWSCLCLYCVHLCKPVHTVRCLPRQPSLGFPLAPFHCWWSDPPHCPASCLD